MTLTSPPADLLATVARHCAEPVPDALAPLLNAVCRRFGPSVAGVLFYGACLRDGDPTDGLVDLYVLVDDYRAAYRGRLAPLANAWLPPNVYYLQVDDGHGRTLRSKCAVLSLAQLEAGTARWFHSYLWGRFAQPVRLAYRRDAASADRIHAALARAVLRLLGETLPCLPGPFTAQALWTRALALCYGCELRPEAADRPARLVQADPAAYRRLTTAAAPALGLVPAADGYRAPSDPDAPARARRRWQARRLLGRSLNVLRLIKSAFTFDDGVDYLAWKLERHTGRPIEVSRRLRRYPLLFAWPLLWKLLRERRLH